MSKLSYIKKNVGYLFVLFLLCVGTSSCTSINDQIVGHWSIEEFYDNGDDLMGTYYSNGIEFKEGGTCIFPFDDWDDKNTEMTLGQWKVLKMRGDYFIKIETKKEIFNGLFKISSLGEVYYPDRGASLIKITLRSENVTIKCAKHKR